jgi:hypothetical protein
MNGDPLFDAIKSHLIDNVKFEVDKIKNEYNRCSGVNYNDTIKTYLFHRISIALELSVIATQEISDYVIDNLAIFAYIDTIERCITTYLKYVDKSITYKKDNIVESLVKIYFEHNYPDFGSYRPNINWNLSFESIQNTLNFNVIKSVVHRNILLSKLEEFNKLNL